MIKMYNYFSSAFCFLFFSSFFFVTIVAKSPKLTVIVVVDQCAYDYLPKLKKHLKYGLNRIVKHGVNFCNAHYPHAKLETAVGHAALNTGTYPEYHGFIGNKWWDSLKQRSISCDLDLSGKARVFGKARKKGGRSPKNLMVEGISERFVFSNNERKVFSFSIKSRSAIGMAGHVRGHQGGAFWIENSLFTTSRYYFQKIPDFIEEFNKEKKANARDSIFWQPFYPAESSAYKMVNKNSYNFAQYDQFFDKTKRVNNPDEPGKYNHYWYDVSPHAICDLFEAGKRTVEKYCVDECKELLLWLSFSGLDKLGHSFGPDSYETIDYMYHFDYALEDFIYFAKKAVNKRNFMLVFTADHAVSSMPEILNQENIITKRVFGNILKEKINKMIEEKFDVKNAVIFLNAPDIYLNYPQFADLEQKKIQEITSEMYIFLKQQEWIKQVWSFEELFNKPTQAGTIEDAYKKSLYPGRSGDFIMHVRPSCLLTNYHKGAGHDSPYATDTHVPLILYGPKRFVSRKIYDKVSILQLIPTLAFILGTNIPTAAEKNVLPKIFERDPLYETF